MKLSLLLASAVLAFAAPSPTSTPTPSTPSYKRVDLKQPQNWVAAGPLFPDNVIAGYSDDLDNYTAESWSKYVLKKCAGFKACTSAISYSGINSGSAGGRFWFGFVFRGGQTTQDNYTRAWDVEDTVAYTVSKYDA